MSRSYQLTIDEKDGYLHFRVTGPNSPETVRGYLADVYYACAQRICSSILIEENFEAAAWDYSTSSKWSRTEAKGPGPTCAESRTSTSIHSIRFPT